MLLRAERQLVTAEVTTVLQGSANMQVTIGTIFQGERDAILEDIPPGIASHADAAERVVGRCLVDRWTRTPSLLEILLANLIARGVKVAELTRIRNRVAAKVDPNLDPLASSWISANRPFFGRVPTRSVVKGLLDSGDSPILRIEGLSGSGKSYTSDWLDYVAAPDRCNFRIVVVTLEEKTGATMEPDVLAIDIVSKMGQPLNHGITPNMNRYEQRLCSWVVSSALAPTVPPTFRTWIVLDGFDDPDLHEGSKKLIQLLAEAVLSGDLNRRVRLVLIDFKSKLTRVDAQRIKCDGLPDPDGLSGDELEACLRQHFVDIEQDVDDQFLKDLAAQLITEALAMRADPEFKDDPRLKLINRKVSKFRHEDLKRIGRIP